MGGDVSEIWVMFVVFCYFALLFVLFSNSVCYYQHPGDFFSLKKIIIIQKKERKEMLVT